MDARERLIDSTRELLCERGYVGTSPKTIQDRSGAGQGSMYHHFHMTGSVCAAAGRGMRRLKRLRPCCE
jgi:TetR/AcrR family transcriptional regulator, transcriptional repressor for nem operon